MKKFMWLFLGAVIPVVAYAADAPGPDWAFVTPDANAPAPAAGAGGAAPAAPAAQPGVPAIVTAGKGADVRACNTCHLPSGMGQPESANLRGLHPDYFARQMTDFKSGDRGGPRAAAMAAFAKNLTDDEVKEIAEYYAGLKQVQWTRLTESESTPKTVVGRNSQRSRAEGNETEPLGKRIIEFASLPALVRQDTEAAFIAFAPPGSLTAGRNIAETGAGKTEACTGCHGDDLKGADDIPSLVGRSPTYLARQLYSFKNEFRKGGYADVMKDIATPLTDDDIISVAAYISNLNPS